MYSELKFCKCYFMYKCFGNIVLTSLSVQNCCVHVCVCVCVCMCVCVCQCVQVCVVCVCVCVFANVYKCVCVVCCVCACVCACVCVPMCTNVCACVCVCAPMCTSMCVCVRVLCVCVHTYIRYIYYTPQAVTDNGLHKITLHCHQLQQLNISGCDQLTDLSLRHLGSGCPHLR